MSVLSEVSGDAERCPAIRVSPRGTFGLRRAGAALLVLAWLTATVARGDALSLAAAQRLALLHNADWRMAEANVEAAMGQVRSAREFPNPTLTLSTTGINTDGRGNSSPRHNEFLQRSYDSIVSLNQLFEIGKRRVRQDSARAAQRAAEAQRDDQRRLLLQAVTQAYVAALVALEDGRVLSDSAGSLRRESELANTRLQAGDISASDQAQIEIAADRFDLEAETAQHTARAAKIALEALLGERMPSGSSVLTDTLAGLANERTEVSSTAPAAGARPDIAAAEANVAKAESDLLLQRRERLPDLSVSAQFEHHPPDQPDSGGLGLSLPLPLWNRNGGAILAARAAREQAEAQLEKTRIQASADIATLRSALRDAEMRAAAYQRNLLPKSADVLRAVSYAYEKGGASLLELLSAQRNDNDIKQGAAHAAADVVNARVALAAALNRLNAPVRP